MSKLLGIWCGIDEFNTSVLANLVAWELKKSDSNIQLFTFGFKEYLPIYSYFDHVYLLDFDTKVTPVDDLANDRSLILSINEQIDAKTRALNLDFISQSEVQSLCNPNGELTLHQQVFRLLTKHLLLEGPLFDLDRVNSRKADSWLENRNISKYELIIGRNRKIHKK